MALSREEVVHIATLCRISLTEEEIDRMGEQLSHILEQFDILGQVPTDDVPPTSHAVALQSVLRDDEAKDSFDVEDVLANAPRRQGDQFRVRAVVEE